MSINPQLLSLTNSATLKLTALTKQLKGQGKDVVNFTAGEPDFDTPDFIKEAAKKAIDEGFTKYTPASGEVALREQIAGRLKTQNIETDKNRVIVTSGAKFAVYAALLAMAAEGDEILIPVPYWVSYPEMVKLTPASLKFIELFQENGFKLTPEILKKSITPKTKALILNYPNNPTGITYTKQELEDIALVIKEHGIFVISDEIYEALVYDKRTHTSFASLDAVSELTLTVSGFSKSFSMTGWRIGYLTAAQNIVDQIAKLIAHTTSCACSISQAAALAAFEDKSWEKQIREKFEARRDLTYNLLKQNPKIKPFKSEGTFYMFCDIQETGLSSFDFCSRLLEEELVSCMPSEPFGKDGFIRLSFSTGIEQINKGIDRINKFVHKL